MTEIEFNFSKVPVRKNIPEDQKSNAIKMLQEWLGEDGIKQFKDWRDEHGTVSPVIFNKHYPHCVHFREGMQVRNFLRNIFKEWTDHDYDNNWQWLVEEAIEKEPIKPVNKSSWWKWKFWK